MRGTACCHKEAFGVEFASANPGLLPLENEVFHRTTRGTAYSTLDGPAGIWSQEFSAAGQFPAIRIIGTYRLQEIKSARN
jgi:hypothetical protein